MRLYHTLRVLSLLLSICLKLVEAWPLYHAAFVGSPITSLYETAQFEPLNGRLRYKHLCWVIDSPMPQGRNYE